MNIQDFDFSVSPRDDFYQFCNGGWLSSQTVPNDKSWIGTLESLSDETAKALQGIIEKSDSEIISNFYQSASVITEDTLHPIRFLLEDINQIQSVNDIVRVSALVARYDITTLFWGCWPLPDSKNPSRIILGFYQSGLELGQRTYYLDSGDSALEIRAKYVEYLEHLLSKSTTASNVLDFEVEMAKLHLDDKQVKDLSKNYFKLELTEIQALNPLWNWEFYFETIGLSIDDMGPVLFRNMEYMKGMLDLICKTPIETIKAYMTARVLSASLHHLKDDSLALIHFNFHSRVMKGIQAEKPKAAEISATISSLLKGLIGQIYCQHHFSQERKEEASKMVQFIKNSFLQRISNSDWLTTNSKDRIKEKIVKADVKIGYPDVWPDYSDLKSLIKPTNHFYTNVLECQRFNFDAKFRTVNKPTDRKEWRLSPYEVDAAANAIRNELVFTAALLQEPFFYLDNPALCFGAFGATFGHELTHLFDGRGRRYNADGMLEDWWSTQDQASFDLKSKQLVAHFNQFKVHDTQLNGIKTLNENIADLGGLKVAFDAMMDYLKVYPAKEHPKFTHQQLFFISWAIFHRKLATKEQELSWIATDCHALGRFRVNGPLSNLKEFHEAFQVQDGDAMFSKEMISIW